MIPEALEPLVKVNPIDPPNVGGFEADLGQNGLRKQFVRTSLDCKE
jgi:hypothetical protein